MIAEHARHQHFIPNQSTDIHNFVYGGFLRVNGMGYRSVTIYHKNLFSVRGLAPDRRDPKGFRTDQNGNPRLISMAGVHRSCCTENVCRF